MIRRSRENEEKEFVRTLGLAGDFEHRWPAVRRSIRDRVLTDLTELCQSVSQSAGQSVGRSVGRSLSHSVISVGQQSFDTCCLNCLRDVVPKSVSAPKELELSE